MPDATTTNTATTPGASGPLADQQIVALLANMSIGQKAMLFGMAMAGGVAAGLVVGAIIGGLHRLATSK